MSSQPTQNLPDIGRLPLVKRRSSIIQKAQKAGIPLVGGDILSGLSANLQQHLVRISNGAKSSLGAKPTLTFLPTPQGACNSRANGNSNQKSSIPRSVRGGVHNNTSTTRTRTLQQSVQSNIRSKSKPPVGSTVQKGIVGNSKSSSKPTLRRSTSMDWTAMSYNGMVTPMCTPQLTNSTKTPGSLRSWGSQSNLSNRDAGGTNFKLPGSKDVKILQDMMAYVHTYMNGLGFPNLPVNPMDLRNVSTNQFLNMVNSVGRLLVGEKFFNTKDDPTARIVELSNILKYPAAISKSHLKSANAQHSWPACLTFLCWLCCRAECAYDDEPGTPMSELFDDAFPRIALENYMNIYHAELVAGKSSILRGGIGTGEGQGNFETLDYELLKFREKVSEQLMGESHWTLEELQAAKEEKLQELEALRAAPNPTKEVLEAIAIKKCKVKETREKMDAAKERIASYKNLHSLQSEAESLRMEIQSRQSEIDLLRQEVKSQPMDKKAADKMTQEIQEKKNQGECLRKMNQQLQSELDAQNSTLEDLDNKYRQVVAQFTVVETFNANLSNLQVDGLTVPVNPFNAEDLDIWLNSVAQIHEKTEKVSQAWVDALKRDQQNVREAIIRAEAELIEAKRQLDTKKVYANAGTRFQREQERPLQEKVKNLEDVLSQLTSSIEAKEQELEEMRKKIATKQEFQNEQNKRVQEVLESKAGWEKAVEEQHADYLLTEAKIYKITADRIADFGERLVKEKQDKKDSVAAMDNKTKNALLKLL